MKEVIIDDINGRITCEVEDMKLFVRFDDDGCRFSYPLRKNESYEEFKNYLIDIYESNRDKNLALCIINDTLQSDEMNRYVYFDDRLLVYDPRTEDEIDVRLNEAWDKVWLMRSHHCDNPKIEESRLRGVERILSTYDDIPEDGYDDWECGYWNGVLGTLRWVLGEDEGLLDT